MYEFAGGGEAAEFDFLSVGAASKLESHSFTLRCTKSLSPNISKTQAGQQIAIGEISRFSLSHVKYL